VLSTGVRPIVSARGCFALSRQRRPYYPAGQSRPPFGTSALSRAHINMGSPFVSVSSDLAFVRDGRDLSSVLRVIV
jgi:hypothetical protein